MYTTSRALALAFGAALLFSTAACTSDGEQGATAGEGMENPPPPAATDPMAPSVGDMDGTMGDSLMMDTTGTGTMGPAGTGTGGTGTSGTGTGTGGTGTGTGSTGTGTMSGAQ